MQIKLTWDNGKTEIQEGENLGEAVFAAGFTNAAIFYRLHSWEIIK